LERKGNGKRTSETGTQERFGKRVKCRKSTKEKIKIEFEEEADCTKRSPGETIEALAASSSKKERKKSGLGWQHEPNAVMYAAIVN